MSEPQIKGDIIRRILDQVLQKWGRSGLDTLGFGPEGYGEEQWYPFEEASVLLAKIKSELGNNNPLTIYQLGLRSVKEDPRWRGIFTDMDPAELFMSTKRQDGQYRIGPVSAAGLGPKHVRVEVAGALDSLWLEFYRGRLQGILELTGRTGVAHLLPPLPGKDTRAYDIKWG